MDQYQLTCIAALLGIIFFPGKVHVYQLSLLHVATQLYSCLFAIAVSIISCQVYSSEYAYHDDFAIRAESASARCRRYEAIDGLRSTDFIHCDGTQLKLADTNLGTEQFSSSSHYQCTAGSDGQLLFIFPTKVSLTAITLHYYSDSDWSLPRLRFYAVPDDFDIWDAPTSGTPYGGVASIPPGGDIAGHRSVSINVNFNTKKVLMYKYSSSFQLAVSEVQFFNSSCKKL